MAVVSKTNAVRAAAAKEGYTMGAVAINIDGEEGEDDTCKPANIILASKLSQDTRDEVLMGIANITDLDVNVVNRTADGKQHHFAIFSFLYSGTITDPNFTPI